MHRPTLVCILSDTHGHLDQRVAEQVSRCDIAVHAGDIGNAAVLAMLSPRSGEVYAVLGNNDVKAKWPVSDHTVLSQLPEQHQLQLPGGMLSVEHGHRTDPAKGRHGRLRRRHPDARAIVYGHSHLLGCDTACEPWILNPGAAGRTRTFDGPSCLVLHAGKAGWQVERIQFPKPVRI